MNEIEHLPYEEWLLSRESLTTQQQTALDQHLETCPACRQLATAWSSVVLIMQAIPEVEPSSGFSQRWQVLQAKRHALHHRRTTILIFSLFFVGLLAILAILALPEVGGLPTPVELTANAIRTISVTLASLRDIRDVLQVIFANIPLAGPILVWIVVTTSLALWMVVWTAVVWRLPKTIRSRYEARN